VRDLPRARSWSRRLLLLQPDPPRDRPATAAPRRGRRTGDRV